MHRNVTDPRRLGVAVLAGAIALILGACSSAQGSGGSTGPSAGAQSPATQNSTSQGAPSAPASSGQEASSGAGAATGQASAATSSSSASDGESIPSGSRFTMMIQSTPNVSKVVEAHAVGLLAAQGVKADIKWNSSTPNVAITELTRGDIDAYSEGLTGGIAAAAAGVKITDFALAQPRQDYVFLAKGITSLKELKGKKIGVQDTTGANYAQALLVLQKAGLTVKDVTIIAVGGQSARLPALVAGRVDATMLSHSAQIALAGQGFNTLFDYTTQATDLYDDNVFATPDWLAKNRALAVAFNADLLKSYQWFDDPANADAVVQEALKIQKGADAKQTAQLFDILRKAKAYPQGTILSLDVLNRQQNLYKSAGALTETVPVNKWADDSYAKAALAQVGS